MDAQGDVLQGLDQRPVSREVGKWLQESGPEVEQVASATMLVRHYMTREVFTLTPDTSCRKALIAFQKDHFRHAPVVQDEKLVGVVSERDLLRVTPGSVAELGREVELGEANALVRRAMTRNPLTVGPNTWLDDAARLLIEKKIGCLPVVERGRLVGITTADDLFRAFLDATGSGNSQRYSWRRVNDKATFDIAVACAALDLRLTSLITHRGQHGAEFLVVRVNGSSGACEQLIAKAASAGYQLFASEHDGSRMAG